MSETFYNEVSTEIRKTNNYDMFRNILGNRDLRNANYNKLLKSMREKQLIIPILVNEKLEIIDGQHRYEACKELKLPLYYYIIPGYEIEDVKRANLVSCNWVLEDYLNLNVEIGKTEYVEFMRIKNKYGLSTSQLLEIFSKMQGRSMKECRMLFEDGSFLLENRNDVYEFLHSLVDFEGLNESRTQAFTKAFLKLYVYENYDHSTMQKRLKRLSHKLEKKATFKEYLSLLVDEIYCFGPSKVTFRYDMKNDRFYEIVR